MLYVRYMADAQTWVYPTDLVNPLVKDVWYVLRLQVLPSGVGTVEVWRQDNPAQKWGYVAPMPDGVTYQFQHWVWGGTSWLDNYEEFDLVPPAAWTTSHQYSVLDQLTRVTDSLNATTVITYNGDGQLTKQVNPDGTGTVYLGVVEYELNTNGTTAGSTSYYALPGARAVRTSAGLFYVLTDHLGSASVSLDNNGVVVAEMRYDAFGATRLSVGTMPGDRLYTGQVWQQGIGLYYFNARWYSPYLNRFVSADTLVPEPGNPQTLIRYSYVYNRPTVAIDPTGHYLLVLRYRLAARLCRHLHTASPPMVRLRLLLAP